jgi:hypothetical protein
MRTTIIGFVNKKLLLSILLLSLTGMAFAVDLTVIKPHFTGTDSDLLNERSDEFFGEFEDTMRAALDFLPGSFPKLAGAFANASVFSSDGASQRGYEGYNAFSFTVGFMSALQFPSTLLDKIMDAVNDSEDEMDLDFIKDNMDIGLGVDFQILNAQFGINTSKFLLDRLYLGFKFSKFDTNWIDAMSLSGFSFKTMSVGFNASYQLIKQKRLPAGIFVWRGLNLGTGFIWQNTSLGLKTSIPIDDDLLSISIEDTIENININLDNVFRFDIETNTYIIPIEAMTSVRLLWFLNLALGAGVDIAFGSSSIKASGSFDVKDYKLPAGVEMTRAPSLSFGLGGKSAPSIFNLKLMGAVGFNVGPVIIDIPVTYYPLSDGYSLGVTVGVTL